MKMQLCCGILCLAVSTSFAEQNQQVRSAEQHHLHDQIDEEIIVTAAFRGSAAETALAVSVLTGEALKQQVANSLGETLRHQLGVNVASFGTGVGQVVIRGQSGKRVQVLQNSVALSDAAAISPDHANALEPLLADRIEVVRGPATLLYGSGAIGGVVNVIDQRIPTRIFARPKIVMEQSYNAVNEENKSLFAYTGSAGSVGFHLDTWYRTNKNVEIPGFAVDAEAIEALEVLHGEEADHEEEAHDEEDQENSRGFIRNSSARSDGYSAGMSWLFDSGYLGIAVNETNNRYGLPPGSHSHEEHEDHEEGDSHEDEGGESVRINMQQKRYDIKFKTSFDMGVLKSFEANIGFTDYQHDEIEVAADGDKEVGTVFKNKAYQSRFTLSHEAFLGWQGVLGLQLGDSQFSALGEEGFIPKSDISNLAVFAVERIEPLLGFDSLVLELGLRYEQNQIDLNGSACSSSEGALSASASLLYDMSKQTHWVFSLARSERAATVEELYSNIDTSGCVRPSDNEKLVLHAATGLIEVGNTKLGSEVSTNFELGLRHNIDSGFGAGDWELSVFYNRIDDYIYLRHSGESADAQEIALYDAKDAVFFGLEAAYEFDLADKLSMRIFTDMVRAEFKQGTYVPRIPPTRLGGSLSFYPEDWLARLEWTYVDQQDRHGDEEQATDGYQRLSFYADYHWDLANNSELTAFLKLDNLLDEEIRNHASLLKNYAPEAGRSLRLGLRFLF